MSVIQHLLRERARLDMSLRGPSPIPLAERTNLEAASAEESN